MNKYNIPSLPAQVSRPLRSVAFYELVIDRQDGFPASIMEEMPSLVGNEPGER